MKPKRVQASKRERRIQDKKHRGEIWRTLDLPPLAQGDSFVITGAWTLGELDDLLYGRRVERADA
jgi:hypothetical protein